MKLITAIVITYNQPEYLFETLDSILNQDYPSIELLIADDGTPDLDVESITTYIREHNKGNIEDFTVLYDGVNRGTVRNINRALKAAKGEYIKLIGGDDTYASNDTFSSEVNKLSEQEDLLGVVSKIHQCDKDMNVIFDERTEKSNLAIPKVLYMDYKSSRRYIAKNNIFPIAVQATMYKKRFFEECGYCDEDYYLIEDVSTALKVLRNANRFAFLDMYTVNHRSEVGISISKELFSVKRINYYKDAMIYGQKEIKYNSDVYGRLYSYCIPNVNKYVYEMALAKKSNNKIKMVPLTVRHCISLTYYFIYNAGKVFTRIGKAMK